MKRILHISDLHFGRIHPPAIKSLEDFLGKQENKIDLIVMTGDWTQRARLDQYQAAAEFITRAKVPVLTIPGNHDIPLYNFFARLLQPLRHYNRYVRNLTVDSVNDPEVVIVGFQTANQFRTVEGRILEKDIARAKDLFNQAPADAIRIIACHHPIFVPKNISKIKPRHLVDEVLALKPDIILSGHSHLNWIEQVETNQHQILHISAGSATSNRLRGEVNSFHIIETHSRQVAVETFYLSEDGFILKKDQNTVRFLMQQKPDHI
jgi:3',5'-cyclic AMP phosphodiesterase CpdA